MNFMNFTMNFVVLPMTNFKATTHCCTSRNNKFYALVIQYFSMIMQFRTLITQSLVQVFSNNLLYLFKLLVLYRIHIIQGWMLYFDTPPQARII